MIKNPFVISALLLTTSILLALGKKTFWFILLLPVVYFLYVAFSPSCRNRENVWLFVLSAVALLPFNVRLILLGFYYGGDDFGGPVGRVAFFIMAYATLFSLEELGNGMIGRIIWREQTELRLDSE